MGVVTSAQKTLTDLQDFSLTTINSNIEFETDVFGRDPTLINGCKIDGQYIGFTVKEITLTAVVNQTKGVKPVITIFGAIPVEKNNNTYSRLNVNDLSWTNGIATFLVAVEDHRSKTTSSDDIFFESILGGVIEIKGTYGGQSVTVGGQVDTVGGQSDTVIINWKKILKESTNPNAPKISQMTNYHYKIADTRPPYSGSPWPQTGWTQDETKLNIELEKYYWTRERVYYNTGTAIPDSCNALRFYNISKIDQDFLDKKNIKTISLYKRSNTVPARPTKDLTYDPAFLNGTYIPAEVDGWIPQAIPDGSLPCYVITYEGQCNFRKPIVIHTADWTDPIIYNENYIQYTIYSTVYPPQSSTISVEQDDNYPYRGTISVPEDFKGQTPPYPSLDGWVGPDGKITWTWVKYLGEDGADAVRYYMESEPTQIIRDVLGQISSSACTIKTYKVKGDSEPTKLNSTQVKYKLKDSNNHYITITGEQDESPEGTFIEPAYGNLNLNFTNSEVRARFSNFAYITVSAFNSSGNLLTTQQINYLVDSEAIINLHDELYIGDGVTIKEGLKLKSGDNLFLNSNDFKPFSTSGHNFPTDENETLRKWGRVTGGTNSTIDLRETTQDFDNIAAYVAYIRNTDTTDTSHVNYLYSTPITMVENWQGLALTISSYFRADIAASSGGTPFSTNNPVAIRITFYDQNKNLMTLGGDSAVRAIRNIITKNANDRYVYNDKIEAAPFKNSKYQYFNTTIFFTKDDLGLTQAQWEALTNTDTANPVLTYIRIAFTLYGSGYVRFAHPKAEYGAFGSGWSQAPADNSYTMAEFKVTQNNISSTVTAINDNFWEDSEHTVTRISQIDQKADAINLSVQNNLTTGINYCSNSQLYPENGHVPNWTMNDSINNITSDTFNNGTTEKPDNQYLLNFTIPSSGSAIVRNTFINDFAVTEGNKYCFSCQIQKNNDNPITIRIRTSYNSQNYMTLDNHDGGDPTTRTITGHNLGNIFGKVTISGTAGTGGYDAKKLVIEIRGTSGTIVTIRKPKFEKGHIATAWMPETFCAGSNVTITNEEISMTTPKFSLTVPKNTDGTGGTSFILQNDKVEFNAPKFNLTVPKNIDGTGGTSFTLKNDKVEFNAPQFNLTVPKNTNGTGGTSFILQNDKVEFNTPQFNINIPADNDQNVALNKDGLVVGSLTADSIDCTTGTVILAYTGPTEITLDNASTEDLKSIFEKLSGHYISKDVTITLNKSKGYSGNFLLQGAFGPGTIRIIGESGYASARRTIEGTLRLLYNNCKIELNHFCVTLITDRTDTPDNIKGAVTCYGNTYVYVEKCQFRTYKTGTASNSAYAICSRYGNKLVLGTDNIMSIAAATPTNYSRTLYVTDGSSLWYNDVIGNLSTHTTGYWLYATDSIVVGHNLRPWGSRSFTQCCLTSDIDGTGTAEDGTTPIPTPPVSSIKTSLTATATASYNITGPKIDDTTNLQQGKYEDVQYASFMWFDLDSESDGIPSRSTTQNANLTIRRMPGAGSGLSVELHLCTLSGDGRSSSSVSDISSLTVAGDYKIGTLTEGKTGTFSVPAAVIDNLINGTIQAIGFYVNETPTTGNLYSKNYSVFNGRKEPPDDDYNPKLEITYIPPQQTT